MATTPPRTSLDSFPPSSPAKPSSGPSADVAAFAPIRSSQDYGNHLDSDLEDDYDSSATYAAPSRTGTGRHRATPSTQGLLAGGDDSDDAPGSPRTARRQTKLRRTHEVAQEEDYEGRPSWRSSGREFLRRNEGFLLIAMAQAFFSTISVCVKLLQELPGRPMPVWELIAIRMSFTWLGCYGYMRYTHVEHPFLGPPGVRLWLVARGVIGLGGLAPGYYALHYISLSDATALAFLAPVLVGVLAYLFLGEPYSLTEALTGVLSLFGVLLIAKPTFLFHHDPLPPPLPGQEIITTEQRNWAVLVALGGAFGAAGAYLTIRVIGKRASALHSISYFSLYSVLVSLLFPLFVHSPPVFIFSVDFFLLILPIGLCGFAAQALLTMGLQREKAGRGTLAVYTNMLFAIILERIVFHQLPDVWSVLGASIIVAGAVRVALEKSKVKGVEATANGDDIAQKEAEEGNLRGIGLRTSADEGLGSESEDEDDDLPGQRRQEGPPREAKRLLASV